MGAGVAARFINGTLPALPFAYFATVPDDRGRMVLYPESVFDVPNVGDFAAALFSTSLPDALVILATVNDEDVLRLRFFQYGESTEEYCTEPGQPSGEELPPSGGDADKLATMFGITDPDLVGELSDVLRAPRLDDQFGFGEAKERHAEIAQLLDLPASSSGIGYESLQRGLMPESITQDGLRHFPTDDGFADAGLKLRQYMLFAPLIEESEAQVAARFLPDVIAWEDDFLEEPTPILGTVATLQNHISTAFPELSEQGSKNWLSVLDDQYDLLEMDLGSSSPDTDLDHLTIFTLSENVPTVMLAQLCDGMPWAVWSYETRQIVLPSAALAN